MIRLYFAVDSRQAAIVARYTEHNSNQLSHVIEYLRIVLVCRRLVLRYVDALSRQSSDYDWDPGDYTKITPLWVYTVERDWVY